MLCASNLLQTLFHDVKIRPVKDTYFSPQNIAIQATHLLQHASSRPRELALIPEQVALLVLDMQDYFLRPESHAYIPTAATIIPGLQQLIAAFVRRQWPIVFTQHLNTAANAGMMTGWWRDLITADNPLSAITTKLDTRAGQVLQKTQYDAFYQTDLEARLHQHNVHQVIVCGVMTHLCCETTARSAFVRGFEVIFPVDGTATYNRKFHLATLTNLAHGFAHLTQVSTLLSLLGAAHAD